MKPIPALRPSCRPAYNDGGRLQRARIFPSTDYHFKPSSEIIGSAGARPEKNRAFQLRMFRRISSNFLGPEMSRNYVREASLFALIAGVSAWPIISMIRALIAFLK